MRRILIDTRQPWLHRGYMVVGLGEDYSTKVRLECRTIDDPAKAEARKTEIIGRDSDIITIDISEVRP